MVDEEEKTEDKPKTKKEEKALSILEEVKQQREAVEKANEESRKLIDELKLRQAEAMLAGRGEAGIQPEKPKELTPQEYADAYRKGLIKEKLPGLR